MPVLPRFPLWLAIVASLAAPACGPMRKSNYYSVSADGTRSEKYSRINEYTSYEAGALGAQARIAAAYEDAEHAPAPALSIEIFNASLPAGVTLENGILKIAPDAPYQGVGRFELGYWLTSAPQETDISDDLKRLGSVTHADVAVVEVQRVAHGDTRVNYVNGILLRKRAVATASAPNEVGTAAHPQRRFARLIYQASGDGCLTATEFADEISAKLGYSPWAPTAGPRLSAEIVKRDGQYRATVRLAEGEPKQLSGSSCKTLTDALISVVVVQLDEPSSNVPNTAARGERVH